MLTPDEVERIAVLARLALTDAERERFARQLSDILGHADSLSLIDVSGIPPTASVSPARSVMRDGDAAEHRLSVAEALANAPRSDGASFIVQAALAGDES